MPKVRTERTRAAPPSPHSRQASEQAKQEAFDAVPSGQLSARATTRKFGVPAQSIGRWLKLGCIPDRHQSSLSLLTSEEEEQLCVYLERLSLAAHPLSHRQLRLAALQIIARKAKLANSTDETKYPTKLGKNWTYRFLLRHNTNLHIMKSQLLEAKRASMANPKQMSIWFKVWEESCKALGLDPRDDKTWGHIYNIDETGRRSGMHGGKKIISKKMSRPYVEGSVGRENISILSGICGDGTWVDPLIIFKGTRVLSKWWSDFGVDEWRPSFAVSPKGWIDSDLKVRWLKQYFVPHIRKTVPPDEWVLVLVDGHSSNLSLEFLEACVENNVAICCLPAHITHLGQPLDVGVFGANRTYWEQSGWAKSGLLPLDPSRVPFADLAPGLAKTLTARTVVSDYSPYGEQVRDFLARHSATEILAMGIEDIPSFIRRCLPSTSLSPTPSSPPADATSDAETDAEDERRAAHQITIDPSLTQTPPRPPPRPTQSTSPWLHSPSDTHEQPHTQTRTPAAHPHMTSPSSAHSRHSPQPFAPSSSTSTLRPTLTPAASVDAFRQSLSLHLSNSTSTSTPKASSSSSPKPALPYRIHSALRKPPPRRSHTKGQLIARVTKLEELLNEADQSARMSGAVEAVAVLHAEGQSQVVKSLTARTKKSRKGKRTQESGANRDGEDLDGSGSEEEADDFPFDAGARLVTYDGYIAQLYLRQEEKEAAAQAKEDRAAAARQKKVEAEAEKRRKAAEKAIKDQQRALKKQEEEAEKERKRLEREAEREARAVETAQKKEEASRKKEETARKKEEAARKREETARRKRECEEIVAAGGPVKRPSARRASREGKGTEGTDVEAGGEPISTGAEVVGDAGGVASGADNVMPRRVGARVFGTLLDNLPTQ
ncbi:hypothetical protein P7C70_g8551, partial [Phenoliferia sp. Uapishka_3]